MYSKLYIIGNGFDLGHDIPTKYSDFLNFLLEEYPQLFGIITAYLTEDDLWTNFEEALGLINVNDILKSEEDEAKTEEDEPEHQFSLVTDRIDWNCKYIEENLKEKFKEWIEQIEISQSTGTSKVHHLDKKATYLTFNYTNTLEEIYKIPSTQILHIHGDTSDPIFGHNTSLCKSYTDEPWIISDEAEDNVKSLFDANKKPVLEILNNNNDFFMGLSTVTEVKIMGHSLNDIDMPYIEEIAKNVSPQAIWRVSFFKKTERRDFKKKLKDIGIPLQNIKLVPA